MSARKRVAITGSGLVSPLGDDATGLHEALVRGETALRPVEAFDASGLPCGDGYEVRDLDPKRYLGEGNLRPLDRTARLAASASGLALENAGWDEDRRRSTAVGLVMGTMYCSVHTISEFDRRALTAWAEVRASRLAFANSVINAAAGQTAIWHGLEGRQHHGRRRRQRLRPRGDRLTPSDQIRSGRSPCPAGRWRRRALLRDPTIGFFKAGFLTSGGIGRTGSSPRSVPLPPSAQRLASLGEAFRRSSMLEPRRPGALGDGSLRCSPTVQGAWLSRFRSESQGADPLPKAPYGGGRQCHRSGSRRTPSWTGRRTMGGRERSRPTAA